MSAYVFEPGLDLAMDRLQETVSRAARMGRRAFGNQAELIRSNLAGILATLRNHYTLQAIAGADNCGLLLRHSINHLVDALNENPLNVREALGASTVIQGILVSRKTSVWPRLRVESDC